MKGCKYFHTRVMSFGFVSKHLNRYISDGVYYLDMLKGAVFISILLTFLYREGTLCSSYANSVDSDQTPPDLGPAGT